MNITTTRTAEYIGTELQSNISDHGKYKKIKTFDISLLTRMVNGIDNTILITTQYIFSANTSPLSYFAFIPTEDMTANSFLLC